MTIELKPCPFCGAELHFEGEGYEHPYSDTCPLDSLYIEDRHITAWNTRADNHLRHEREPVKVKPLVWVHGAKFGGQDHSYADTELGTWCMTAYSGRGGRWAYTDVAGNDSEADWLTRDECQAAVEAAREASILAALEPGERQTVEPVAWRVPDPKHKGWWVYFPDKQVDGQPLYTTPPDALALLTQEGR